MPSFKYRVRLSNGSVQSGLVEAENKDAAALALQERGFDIALLEPVSAFAVGPSGGLGILNRINKRDLVVVSRTLSVMISASVPLVDSVRNIARQTENPRLRSFWRKSRPRLKAAENSRMLLIFTVRFSANFLST